MDESRVVQKLNRISDDSGVEINVNDSESMMTDESSASMTSITKGFKYNYSVNSSIVSETPKRALSHVQKMRLRFENLCSLNQDASTCRESNKHCNHHQSSISLISEGDSAHHTSSVDNSSTNICDLPADIDFEEFHNEPTDDVNSDFEEASENVDEVFEVKNADICTESPEIVEEVHTFEVETNSIGEYDDVSDGEEVVVLSSDADSIQSRPNSLNKTMQNLLNIVEELMDCEYKYIVSLESGIKNYKKIFRDQDYMKKLPDSLRGQDAVIFGNVERIYEFHRDELLPRLNECDRDIHKICEVFCDFIKKDYFYMYVLYAINRTKSEHVCIKNADFFKRRQEEINDRLGLNSFLVKPIQRLPHYQLLFNQMIVELLKNMEDTTLKPLIAICCKTEKFVQKLLDMVNESMHITDIEDCLEINLLHQGKFRKMNQFNILDKSTYEKYKGRLFLFDKSLVYTEQNNKNRLIYRGHYLRTKIGIEPEKASQKNKLILFSERVDNQSIEVSGEISNIMEWKTMIDDIIREFIVEERKRIKKSQKKVRSVSCIGTPIVPEIRSSTRGSIYSMKSFASGSSGSSSDRSSKISYDSNISNPDAAINRRTIWNDRRSADKLLISERSYLRLLEANKKIYIDKLPLEILSKLESYQKYYNRIFNLHTEIFEQINGCHEIGTMLEIYKKYVSEHRFEVYNYYAITIGRVQKIVSDNTEKTNSNFYNDRITLKQFLLLPIKKLSDYQSSFNEILENSFNNGEATTNNFKSCAVIEIEMNHLYNRVSENYKLYAIPDDRIHYRLTGMVEYSDVVTINPLNILNHRMIITKSALICVNFRSNSYKEKFLSIPFLIPLKHLTLTVSKSNPSRLKFVNAETRVIHRVVFQKMDRKEMFQKQVLQLQKKLFRLK